MCANGSTHRSCIPKEEASSPTVTTESVLITNVIYIKQEKHAMPMDTPNYFSQTEVPQGDAGVDPEKHKHFVIRESRNKV